MAAIFYQFALNEIEIRDGLIVNEYVENLPHHQEVADTVKRIWDMCHMETTFDGILAGKIDSCYLRIFTNKKGQTVARIQICLNDGERWSEKKRNECGNNWMHRWLMVLVNQLNTIELMASAMHTEFKSEHLFDMRPHLMKWTF